jgi:hypothetical protein
MGRCAADKETLTKRLRYLWIGELFNAFFLPALVLFTAWVHQKPLGLFAIYSACLLSWLLLQGAAYWWLKLRAVRADGRVGAEQLRCFGVLKRANWALIGTLPILLVVRGLVGAAFSSGLDLAVGVGLFSTGSRAKARCR